MFRTRTTARTPNSRGKLITEGKKKKTGKVEKQGKRSRKSGKF